MKTLIGLILISILKPDLVRAQEVHLAPHAPPAEAQHCEDCHATKNQEFLLTKTKTSLKHADHAGKHGRLEIECGSCHDRNHSNFLRTSAQAPASFENPSAVCQQCHQDRFKDWTQGLHGKRIGGWKGDREQLHCIDCHSPHSVRFKQMEASPAPLRPKLSHPKSKTEDE